MRYLVLIKMII